MNSLRRIRPHSRSEQGYVLAAVIILLAVLMISLAVAMPKVREDIRRDQEVETMHRGQQYIRAVQLFYRKFHRYPASVDALENTNDIRFLRKRYADPLTGTDDWVPVQLGTNKAPLTMGYFGQPLTMGAAVLTGSAPGGGNRIVGASPIVSSFGSSSSSGSPSDSGSSDSGSGSNSSSSPPSTVPILGGAGIIGFSPASEKESILIYKTKTHYNEWEFVYDPSAERMSQGMPYQPPPPLEPPSVGSPGFGPPPSPVTNSPASNFPPSRPLQ